MSEAYNESSRSRRAMFLTALMLLSSWSLALAAVPMASAHETQDVISWPLSGSNDTGWIQLNATIGSDPILSSQATADWILEFAPGAEISNASLQIHVNGSDGLMIDQPLLVANDIGVNLFDWRGLGILGASDSFDGANPYSDRLSPNSATGAGWTLPSDAMITELAFEALAPVDPLTSFTPVTIPITSYAQHPVDGQLYLATGETVLVFDAVNNPAIIDFYDFDQLEAESSLGSISDIAIGPNGNLHVAFEQPSEFRVISAVDGTVGTGLPSFPAGDIGAFEVLDSGIYAANTDGDLYEFSTSWNLILAASTASVVNDIHEEDNILYLATDNGVERYDLSANQVLSSWNSGNVLHSNVITEITTAGNQLLFSSPDNGLARFNWNSGFWLATWNDANWLNSNTVSGAQANQDTLHIMSGSQLHRYNLSTGVFGSSIDLSQMNLTETTSNMMLPWSSGGARAPGAMMHAMTDGSRLVLVDATMQSTMQREIVIASGPSSSSMTDALEHDGILYIAGYASEQVDRFDIANSLWLTSIDTGAVSYTHLTLPTTPYV